MRLTSILFFTLLFTISNFAFSAQVLKVKGPAVLIDTAGDDIRMGKTYYLMANGKKKGIVKVVKLRPGQAIAKLLKGKALANWTLLERTPKRKTVQKQEAPEPTLRPLKRKKRGNKKYAQGKSKLALGFVMGFAQNSSDVDFIDSNGNVSRSDSYSGSSTSFELLADYQLHKSFYLRGSLGMQNFSTEDANNTQCFDTNNVSATCQIDLGYMNMDIWLRYYLNGGNYRFWAGAGLGILFSPKYNSTTALEEADLATTTLMQVGGGADIKLTDKLYIPFWIEYGLFPSSDTVKMTSISGYLGLAYRL